MAISSLGNLAQQERTRREILQRSDLIPALPDAVVQLLARLNQPDTEPGDIEKIICHDQVLVAKMLAMVNSPFYGVKRTIRTVRDAVMVIGFRGLRSLALATSTAKFMMRDFSCYGHAEKGLWLHGAATAAAAKSLTLRCNLGIDLAEQMFVIGLLHDIGKLLLVGYAQKADRAGELQFRSHADERAAMMIDHTEAGALVTAKWNLSPITHELIKAHHDDDPQVSDPRLLAILVLADDLAHELGLGYLPGQAPKPRRHHELLATVGLNQGTWHSMHAELSRLVTEAVASLQGLSG